MSECDEISLLFHSFLSMHNGLMSVISLHINRLVNLFEVKAVPAVLGMLSHYPQIRFVFAVILINSIILAFRNGVVVDKFIGLVDANMIEELIKNLSRRNKQP